MTADDLCGAAHPTMPDVVCTRKAARCWEYHAHGRDITWDNPRKHPGNARTSTTKKRTEIILSTEPVRRVMGQEEGMAAAYEASSDVFKTIAMQCFRQRALSQQTLTTDDIWSDLRAMGVDTGHRAAMGSLVRRAVKEGLIEKTSQMVTTARAEQRAHGLTVWRSLVYRG